MKQRLATILVAVRMLLQIYLCQSRSHHVATKVREAEHYCFHRVQFVQFLTPHLNIIIHFVEFSSSPVNREPQFLAGRIVRRVCP